MELRQLVYFEAVGRHEHITRAAEELSIAQPALSKQIHQLEHELGGVALLERVGRRVRLTDAGRRLLEHARAILAQVEAARAEIRDLAELRRGAVAVGAPPTIGVRLLPRLLAEFHLRHPQLELHIRGGGTQELLVMLERGEVDMAVVTLPVTRRGLWVTPLFREELVVVVGLAHRLAGRRGIRFAELADEPFMLYPPGYEMREATLAACKRAGFAPRIALDGGEMDMLLRLAEAGLGVALMPPLAIGGERLATLRVRDQRLQRSMALVSRPESALTPVARALRTFLAEQLERQEAPGASERNADVAGD